MAGRGTDILLGGNPEYLAKEILKKKGFENPEEAPEEEWKKALEEAIKITSEEKEKVKKLGGLYVIGTERHESRRIDNQLRGRSGRQGDPGESRFIISLEDHLIRLFGGDRVMALMDKLNIPEDEPLESRFVTKAIENAQKRVEAQNFQIRKRILEMDDVMNVQRNVVYKLRRRLLEGEDLKPEIEKYMEDVATVLVNRYAQGDAPELWEIERNVPQEQRDKVDYLEKKFLELTGEKIEIPETVRDREDLKNFLVEKMKEIYSKKEEFFGKALMRELERMLALQILDFLWRRHLHTMDRLKEGIYLRGYAQRDPVTEYKKEAYQMFENFLNEFKFGVLQSLFHVELAPQEPQPTAETVPAQTFNVGELHIGELPELENQELQPPLVDIPAPVRGEQTTTPDTKGTTPKEGKQQGGETLINTDRRIIRPEPKPKGQEKSNAEDTKQKNLGGAIMGSGTVERKKPRMPKPRTLKDRLKERKREN